MNKILRQQEQKKPEPLRYCQKQGIRNTILSDESN